MEERWTVKFDMGINRQLYCHFDQDRDQVLYFLSPNFKICGKIKTSCCYPSTLGPVTEQGQLLGTQQFYKYLADCQKS